MNKKNKYLVLCFSLLTLPTIVGAVENPTCPEGHSCVYDTQGRLTVDKGANPNSYSNTWVRYSYDSATGNLIRETSCRDKYSSSNTSCSSSDMSYKKYDATTGNLTEEGKGEYSNSSNDYNGEHSHTKYDPITGNITETYDGDDGNNSWEYTYDDAGQLVEKRGFANNSPSSYEQYDPSTGNLIEKDNGDYYAKYTYNDANQLIKKEQHYEADGFDAETTYIYDDEGKLKATLESTGVSGDQPFFQYNLYNADGTVDIFNYDPDCMEDNCAGSLYKNGQLIAIIDEFSEEDNAYILRDLEGNLLGSYSSLENIVMGKTIEDEQDESNIKIYNEKDGSYTVYDKDGNFIGYKGKRIYTYTEAQSVVKETGNKFRLRYR